MWDLPGPGLEPVSPALAGGFLTTVPPGKSLKFLVIVVFMVMGNWKMDPRCPSTSEIRAGTALTDGISTAIWEQFMT